MRGTTPKPEIQRRENRANISENTGKTKPENKKSRLKSALDAIKFEA